MKKSRPIEDRFWERVFKDSDSGCWIWQGSLAGKGYGVIGAGGRGGRILYTHRVSWELHFGPITNGLYVCHTCDVRLCVNPSHLFLGTQTDNMQDCRSKGRLGSHEVTRHIGSSNGRAKITESDAQDIRVAYAELPRKQRVQRGSVAELAARYGLTTKMIHLIATGKNWTAT